MSPESPVMPSFVSATLHDGADGFLPSNSLEGVFHGCDDLGFERAQVDGGRHARWLVIPLFHISSSIAGQRWVSRSPRRDGDSVLAYRITSSAWQRRDRGTVRSRTWAVLSPLIGFASKVNITAKLFGAEH